VLAIAGCSSAAKPESTSASGSDSVAGTCFNVRDARGFHALHDRYVYVKCVRERVDRANDRNGESPSEQ
jgi:hypothetical protein